MCEYKLLKDFLVVHTGYKGINAIIVLKNYITAAAKCMSN